MHNKKNRLVTVVLICNIGSFFESIRNCRHRLLEIRLLSIHMLQSAARFNLNISPTIPRHLWTKMKMRLLIPNYIEVLAFVIPSSINQTDCNASGADASYGRRHVVPGVKASG